jgi:hypothetical protein
MNGILNWFTIGEMPQTVFLILLLSIISEQVNPPDGALRRDARRCSAAIFLTYVVLGIGEWRPASVGDILSIVIRGSLAAGVGYGVSALGMALLRATCSEPAVVIRGWLRRRHSRAQFKADELRRQRDQRRSEQQERELQTQQAAAMAHEQQRQAEEQARIERERYVKTDEARAEVIRYYDAHADILYDTLPAALFRTRLQTRFPASIQPDQAWQAAQEMIGEMVPMIATAKGAREQVDQSSRNKATAIERLQRSIRRLEQEQEQIGKTPGFDPDVGEPELRAIRENIRELRDQLESLELSTSESHV